MCDLRRWMFLSRVILGETARNVETRWQEHENTQKDSQPA